jgi:hypothetical protein
MISKIEAIRFLNLDEVEQRRDEYPAEERD